MLRPKHVYTEYNLNELTLQCKVVDSIARRHKLKEPGDCVVFANKSYKRFRILLLRGNGTLWMESGVIDRSDDRGMFLRLLESIQSEMDESAPTPVKESLDGIGEVGVYLYEKSKKYRRRK